MVEQVLRNKRQGRKIQSKVAKTLGGKSVGTIEPQDVSHPIFSIEVKHRKKFLGLTFMNQAVKNCPEGKIPLTVVHVLNQRSKYDLVSMRMCDFIDLLGDLNIKKESDDE
jgi:hypothetical protein